MIQQFQLTDIQRTLLGDAGFAAVTLTPIPQPAGSPAPAVIVYPGAVNAPSPARFTGLAVADVTDWQIGDTVSIALTKVTA